MPTYSGVEINKQISQINNMMKEQIREAQSVKNSIRSFINNSELQSEAYTNQKNYFNAVYISLYNGVEQFSREFIEANINLQNRYSNVDNDINAYINTDALTQEVGYLNSIARYWMNIIDDYPYADYYTDLHRNMANRAQEVINRMLDFTNTSSTNYSTLRAYLTSIINGMNAIKNDCWDAVTGIFNTASLDAGWLDDLTKLNEETGKRYLQTRGITDDQLNYLNELGYSYYDLYELYTSSTKDEKAFLDSLCAGDYRTAFSYELEEMDPFYSILAAEYITRVNDVCIKNNNFSKLEEVLSSLTSSDVVSETYNGSVQFRNFTLIQANHEKLQESLFLSVVSNGNYDENLQIQMNRMAQLQCLYLGSFYLAYDKFGQGWGIKVCDINYNKDEGYTYNVKSTSGDYTNGELNWEYLPEEFKSIHTKDKLANAHNDYSEAMRQIKERRKKLDDYWFNLAIDTGKETIISKSWGLLNEGGVCKKLYNLANYGAAKDKEEQQIKDDEQSAMDKLILDWFSNDANGYSLKDWKTFEQDIYSYENALALHEWSQNGVLGLFKLENGEIINKYEDEYALLSNSFIGEEEVVEQKKQEIMSKYGLQEKDYNCLYTLVVGGYDFTPLIAGTMSENEIDYLKILLEIINKELGNGSLEILDLYSIYVR